MPKGFLLGGIHIAFAVLAVSLHAAPSLAQVTGVIHAVSTQSRSYGSPVVVSYMEPVNCTLHFNNEVVNFGPSSFTKTTGTLIINFAEISPSTYTFQLAAESNANVSVLIEPGTVRNASNATNSATTAFFSFEYFAYPPSVMLRLYGFTGLKTNKLNNLAYLIFNSTTTYNNTDHFSSTFVSISPMLDISNFEQVDDKMYKFNFDIVKNDTAVDDLAIHCVSPSAGLPDANHTQFLCNQCPRSERCQIASMYPPSSVEYVEFPFHVVIDAVPALGMPGTSLSFFYDTLWAEVGLQAPAYARGPFFVTVSWSEALADLTAVQPVFDPSGPAVDHETLRLNLTVMGPTSFRVLVVPAGTGVLSISINGTEETMDLAGNTNNFRSNTKSRTGARVVVVYSAGPPLHGSLSFLYRRPFAPYEYGADVTSVFGSPSLAVSWDSFVTATRYDLWIEWGHNLSLPVVSNLTTSDYVFLEFHAMLGLQYIVGLRAYNIWGDSLVVRKIFLHPKVDVIADGAYKIIGLPMLLSQRQTSVQLHAVIRRNSFLSMNPTKVLSFRTVDQQVGDIDPCSSNSQLLRCTFMNFHVEVPSTQFLVFRQPVRLQFSFGRHGWEDLYFRPQLRYWEAYHEEWRPAVASCPLGQAYENWNDLHRIYTVSLCHLSQFAVFEYFTAPASTTTAQPPLRPESYSDPVLLVVIAGVMVMVLLLCAIFYIMRTRRLVASAGNKVIFRELGIRPVTERLPSRRQTTAGAIGDTSRQDDALELLSAIPAPSRPVENAHDVASLAAPTSSTAQVDYQ